MTHTLARLLHDAAPHVANGLEATAHWLTSALGSFCVQLVLTWVGQGGA